MISPTLDLRPTFCKLLDIGGRRAGHGRDRHFKRDLRGKEIPARPVLDVSSPWGPGRRKSLPPWEFVQPRNGKYPGEPMLFNLDEDPDEAHDLVD